MSPGPSTSATAYRQAATAATVLDLQTLADRLYDAGHLLMAEPVAAAAEQLQDGLPADTGRLVGLLQALADAQTSPLVPSLQRQAAEVADRLTARWAPAQPV